MTGSPRDIWLGRERELVAGVGGAARRASVEALAADHLAVADQLDEQRPVVAVVDRRAADADHLGLGDAAPDRGGAGRTCGRRRRSCRGSSWPPTTSVAGVVLAGHQLVDEAAGRVAAAGDQLGADAVPVDRRRRQRRDGVLVEVAGDDDPGARSRRARRAARAPAGRARRGRRSRSGRRRAPGPATSTAEPHRLGDVVGVDEQRGAAAERLDLAPERVAPRCRAAA